MAADNLGNWLKSNLGVVVSILVLSIGGYVSTVRVSDKLDNVSSRVSAIESNGTESIRLAHKRIDVIERDVLEEKHENRKISDKLDKIDRRIEQFICKTEPKLCKID